MGENLAIKRGSCNGDFMEKSSTEIDDVSNTDTRTLWVQHSDSASCL